MSGSVEDPDLYPPRPAYPDLGEPSKILADYCDAVDEALGEREDLATTQRTVIDEAGAALMSTITEAMEALGDIHDDSGVEGALDGALDRIDVAEGSEGALDAAGSAIRDASSALSKTRGARAALESLVESSQSAVESLLPLMTPSLALKCWRDIWRERTLQRSLLPLLPRAAAAQLELKDLGAVAFGVTPQGRSVWAVESFMKQGATGRPEIDGPLFRRLSETIPGAMLSVLDSGGTVARALRPEDVVGLLSAKESAVRTRAIMAVSRLGIGVQAESADSPGIAASPSVGR